jgi:hypothetical protein
LIMLTVVYFSKQETHCGCFLRGSGDDIVQDVSCGDGVGLLSVGIYIVLKSG